MLRSRDPCFQGGPPVACASLHEFPTHISCDYCEEFNKCPFGWSESASTIRCSLDNIMENFNEHVPLWNRELLPGLQQVEKRGKSLEVLDLARPECSTFQIRMLLTRAPRFDPNNQKHEQESCRREILARCHVDGTAAVQLVISHEDPHGPCGSSECAGQDEECRQAAVSSGARGLASEPSQRTCHDQDVDKEFHGSTWRNTRTARAGRCCRCWSSSQGLGESSDEAPMPAPRPQAPRAQAQRAKSKAVPRVQVKQSLVARHS